MPMCQSTVKTPRQERASLVGNTKELLVEGTQQAKVWACVLPGSPLALSPFIDSTLHPFAINSSIKKHLCVL